MWADVWTTFLAGWGLVRSNVVFRELSPSHFCCRQIFVWELQAGAQASRFSLVSLSQLRGPQAGSNILFRGASAGLCFEAARFSWIIATLEECSSFWKLDPNQRHMLGLRLLQIKAIRSNLCGLDLPRRNVLLRNVWLATSLWQSCTRQKRPSENLTL